MQDHRIQMTPPSGRFPPLTTVQEYDRLGKLELGLLASPADKPDVSVNGSSAEPVAA